MKRVEIKQIKKNLLKITPLSLKLTRAKFFFLFIHDKNLRIIVQRFKKIVFAS